MSNKSIEREYLIVDRRGKSYAFFIGTELQGNWIGYTDEDEPRRIAELNDIKMEARIAESRGIDLETAQELVYLRDRVIKEPLRLAVGSLLDIVSELTVALEQGRKPDEGFTDTVVETIKKHKKELGFHE